MPDPTTPPPAPPVPEPEPAPKPPKGKKEEPEPKKIELTQEELDAKLTEAAEAEKAKAKKARDKEKQEADETAAKEQGKFKELAEKEKTRAETAEAELRKRDLRDSVRDYLRDNHKEYDGCEKYILPHITVEDDASAQDITKQVKAACEQYVKDNPRAKSGGAAPPAQGQRRATTPSKDANGNDQPLKITGMAARF